MVGEAVKTGGVSLAGSYLKRRLLSSAVLVIVVALLVAWAFAPLLFSLSIGVDGIFAALYMLNYRFVAEGINYQNAGAAPAAFQHFWSLCAEQRFYAFWPLLIIAEMVLTRRWWRDLLPVLFLVVIEVSLYILEYLLTADAPMSYFGVQSRAWEFGVGATVALATGLLGRMQLRIRASISQASPRSSGSASRIARRRSSPACARSFPLSALLSPVTGSGTVFRQDSKPGGQSAVLTYRRPPDTESAAWRARITLIRR